jgi:RimJ/RimL family protein N-acetyltransferase
VVRGRAPGANAARNRLSQAPELVTLRDGARVLVRPIASGDKDRLRAAFARLSERSWQLRFLSPKRNLTQSELAYFTEVDHVDHEALVAEPPAGGEILGVARYVRLSSDRQAAEAAIVVGDEWQGRGLGTVLLRRLAWRARAHGIRRFEGHAQLENRRVIELFRKVGDLEVSHNPPLADLTVELPPAA